MFNSRTLVCFSFSERGVRTVFELSKMGSSAHTLYTTHLLLARLGITLMRGKFKRLTLIKGKLKVKGGCLL